MKFLPPHSSRAFFGLVALVAVSWMPAGLAQETAVNAADLSAKLSAGVLDGSSTARLKMDIIPAPGAEKTVLQLKVNARRTKEASELHYQVLWPKARQTDSFVLRKPAGQAISGTGFQAPDTVKPLSQFQGGIFGSDLAYEDLVDNYFAWENQTIVGQEIVGRIPCQILESKPGKGNRSSYGSVRTWIDPKRMVPLKIEKLDMNGKVVRRITITLVAKDDNDRAIPANYAIERPGKESRTILEGTNIRHDVTFTDTSFSPAVLQPVGQESPPK